MLTVPTRAGWLAGGCIVLLALSGCADAPGMPDTCRYNQTAVGAVVLGTGAAAVTAVATHGNKLDTVLAFLAGGAVGAYLGNLEDQHCQQVATQQAMDQALARDQAREASLPVETTAQALAPPPRVVRHYHHKKLVPPPPAAAPEPAYTPVTWTNNSGDAGVIKPVRLYTDAQSGETCATVQNVTKTNGANGPSTQGNTLVTCNVNGKWVATQPGASPS
jgi:hypothetical protein